MTDEEKAARAAELDKAIKAGGNLDKVMTALDGVTKCVDGISKRMDDIEAAQKVADAAAAKAKADAELSPEERAAKEAELDALADNEDDKDNLNRQPGEARPLAADSQRRREGRLVDAQLRADSVAQVFGQKAPAPLSGESSRGYRRRLLREYQHHSAEFKNVDLGAIADPKVFDGIEKSIYADARAAGAAPSPLPDGQLREVRREDETGRSIVSFYGEPKAWMRTFAANRRRVAAIRNQ